MATVPLFGACKQGPAPEEQQPVPPVNTGEVKQPLTWPRTTKHAGLEAIELFPHDADETSPLVVAMHGMGDRPENWVDWWRNFPRKAQVILPRGHTPDGDGFAWFPNRDGMNDDELGQHVAAAEEKLWPGLLGIAGGRKLIVTGFSQGAVLSYVLATRHVDRITHSFPVAGFCPRKLVPKNHEPTVPILAFHGTVDRMLPINLDRETVAALKNNGSRVELREYEGVGHAIPPPMRKDWWQALSDAINAS